MDLNQNVRADVNTPERKILGIIYGPTHEGDDGVKEGLMNSTAFTRSQTLWRTSKLED